VIVGALNDSAAENDIDDIKLLSTPTT